jgi:hypothetical protein
MDKSTRSRPSAQANLLDPALAYAKRGWPVVPLHTAVKDGCSCHKPDCANAGKHPRYHATDLQHGLKNATTDEDLIRRWWRRWRHANIGIVTGNVSGLVIVDIDPRHAGHLTFGDLEAEHGKFPDTVESLTGGGGRHLFYQYPGGNIRISAQTLGPGIDIKADNAYVVAPPSRHASGQHYEWEVTSHPDDIPVAPLPSWFPLHEDSPHDQTSHSQPHAGDPGEGSPGDDFNQRATADDLRAILTRHGWTVVEHRNGIDYLRRPGKTGRSYSATLGAVAPNVFYVFTTNGQPFTAHHGYKPFSVYGLLDHGGDFTAAAKALAGAGYGAQRDDDYFANHDGHAPDVDVDDWDQSSSGNGAGPPPPTPPHQIPTITISTQMTAVVNHMQAAIRRHPRGPFLYQRARQLSMITRGAKPPRWLDRAPDAPIIHPADKAYIRELAAFTATWKKWDARKEADVDALPPPWAIETLMARPRWSFPPLEGIICAPTLRPDGSILDTPGYDQETGLYLYLDHVQFPPLLHHPMIDDARLCVQLLCEVVTDFPFLAEHHKSAALAAVLSLVARFTIQGKVPFFAVRSTTRGAGKGLLIDAISVIATGRHAPRWAQTLDEEEERKRLITIAMSGDAVLHIDNITHPLGSGPLDMAMTAEAITERIMATHTERTAPIKAVFFGSGNNMVFQGDMARRVVPIDLAPAQERPDERENFTHHPLLSWVLEQRPRLVVAALTIIKAYIDAGRPKQVGLKAFGSYEPWSDLVRQSLIWTEQEDPCAGRGDIEAQSDPKYEMQKVVLTAWYERYGDATKTLKEVKDDIDNHTAREMDDQGRWTGRWIIDPAWRDLQGALLTLTKRGNELNTTAIGATFRSWEGRVLADLQLRKAGYDRLGHVQWQVKKLSS